MTSPHHPGNYPADAHPVRPGSSAALTARTIDATVHPPLVRAQETAASIVPRVAQTAATIANPVFLGFVALTLLFILVARRMRYRPSAFVVGALLIVTLSSFNPMQPPEPPQLARARTPRTLSHDASIARGRQLYGADEYQMPDMAYGPQPPDVPDVPDLPEVPEPDPPRYIDIPDYGVQIQLPNDVMEQVPEVSRRWMKSAERMMRENEQLREIMEQLRVRMREEARRERLRRIAAKHHLRPTEIERIGYVVVP